MQPYEHDAFSHTPLFHPNQGPPLLMSVAGVVDLQLEKMARLGTGSDYHNAARKLHAF